MFGEPREHNGEKFLVVRRAWDILKIVSDAGDLGGAEWVTQLLRQSDAQVFKKYSQMKLRMKREALQTLNRRANKMGAGDAGAFMEQHCALRRSNDAFMHSVHE
jgi:hypothetical protein